MLGARAGDLVRQVALGVGGVVAAGVGLGIGLSVRGGRLIASLLYGVSVSDPWVLGAVASILLATAMVAAAAPARRATRIEPAAALRDD